MKIIDSKSGCFECGGCGVLFQRDGRALQRCSVCNRFASDAAAASAAGELIRAVYVANRRSQDLREVSSCGECPCHLVDTGSMGGVVSQRCEALDEELGHDWSSKVGPRCPLRGFKPTLLCK